MARRERPSISGDRGHGALAALIVALLLGPCAASAAVPLGCEAPGSRLVVEVPATVSGTMSSLFAIDPASGSRQRLPIERPRTVTPLPPPGAMVVGDASGQHHLVVLPEGRAIPVPDVIVTAIETVRAGLEPFRSPRWVTQQSRDESGLRLRIIDRSRDRVVVDSVFPRRIEIAANADSPDGRFVVHLQANNVASELTVFDAGAGIRKDLRLPHAAPLAAYAMSLTFSPDGSCLAVSMTRAGNLPETWTVDLRQPVLTARPLGDVFVLAWVAIAPGTDHAEPG
ncbi:MAG TPA: hypothetical protein VGR08_09985 [Thermomicrobiales bacterium]|nr:hypothetical protein [Thermomicrobiales bacterium]